MVLLIISTALAAFYIVFACVRSGDFPVSLSATYYNLKNDGWIFEVVMAAVAVTLMPTWIDVSSFHTEWMAFIACSGLMFVAAAPSFRIPLVGMVHYSSAIVCCLLSEIWQIAEGLWDVTIWFGLLGGMLTLVWRDKWCWWMECAVIGSLLANLWRVIL